MGVKAGTSTNAQTVYNALRARGYSNAAAAGAIGNLQQESGVNPGSKQSGGAGRGIAQWGTGPGSGGRWEVENQYAASHKQDPWALNTQIGFLQQEMNQRGMGAGSAYAKSTNVGSATSQFETGIEQAGIVAMGTRVGYAQNAYAAFSGNSVTPISPGTGKGYSAVPGIHAAPSTGKKASKAPTKGSPGTQNPILGAIGNVGSGIANVPGDVGSALGDVGGAITGPAQAATKIATTLFSVSFWIRVAFILIGAALVFIGTKALLTGSPPNMPGLNDNPSPTPAKAAPVQHKQSFGKSVKHGVDTVGEVAA